MKIPSPDFLKSKWFLILGLLLVGYMFFVLGKMVWQNYKVNQQIKNLESEVSDIEKQNQKLSDLIAYFQTDTFKEKEAREKLGLVKPGEKVLVFPSTGNNDKGISEGINGGQEQKVEVEKTPNYQKWWDYFFASR